MRVKVGCWNLFWKIIFGLTTSSYHIINQHLELILKKSQNWRIIIPKGNASWDGGKEIHGMRKETETEEHRLQKELCRKRERWTIYLVALEPKIRLWCKLQKHHVNLGWNCKLLITANDNVQFFLCIRHYKDTAGYILSLIWETSIACQCIPCSQLPCLAAKLQEGHEQMTWGCFL